LASVESCTGGLIAHELTDVAGASKNFWGSWTVYDNTAKIALGVSPELISSHGAVSSEVAAALAQSGAERLIETLASSSSQMINVTLPWNAVAVVSTTGIAGPTGGSPEKPVGLCYCGVSVIERKSEQLLKPVTQTFKIQAPIGLSRAENKKHFAQKAIELIAMSAQKLSVGS
jgi:PncC family amidohydrolase